MSAIASRLAPGPATYAARRRRRPPPGSEVQHICIAHPRARDGDCDAGCKSFCGLWWVDGGAGRTKGPTPDVCVVCWDLANRRVA